MAAQANNEPKNIAKHFIKSRGKFNAILFIFSLYFLPRATAIKKGEEEWESLRYN